MDLLAMTESETKEYPSVVLATLLHDIGKLIHRRDETTYKTGHHKASSLFITGKEKRLINDSLNDLGLVRFLALHHMKERGEKKEDVLNDPFLQNGSIAPISYSPRAAPGRP